MRKVIRPPAPHPGRRFVWIAVALAVSVLIAVYSHRLLGSRHGCITGRTVIDLAGREVTVPEKVDRLVALGPGALRLVTYLGATDRIVGIEDRENRMERDLYVRPYASVLDEKFRSLPVVGSGGPGALPDFEMILMCRPDLIVTVNIDPAQLNRMEEKTGVPALFLSYGELGVWRTEARRSLQLLGEVLDRGERARVLNGYIASLEEDLGSRTADIVEGDRVSTYIGGISYKGAHGLTSTEGGYPPARMVNALNVVDDLGHKGHVFVDKEQILVWNPDVVFVDVGSRFILEQDLERNRGFYRLLEAARSGRMYSLLPYNHYNTNIELALLNAYFIGRSLYPERFADIRMDDKAHEIMSTFLGIRDAIEGPSYRTLHVPETGPIEWR